MGAECVAAPTAPIIVAAVFGSADHAFLDGLRRAHFPLERNQLDAHLTMFHHLPPSLEDELKARLAQMARAAVPTARLASVMNLGRGIALRVSSPELEAMRQEMAEAFAGALTPQDANRWNPHVTIQNKAAPEAAKTLLREMTERFQPRPLAIAGLAAYRYRGGPWEPILRYPFRGGR